MKTIYLSFSTGIARFPADAQSAPDLLRSAETAMFKAKRENPGGHVFSDDTKNDTTRKRYLLEIDLRHAIENDALDVYFQPVVSVADNRIIGAEGLARWHHPEHGPVSPGIFIPIEEEIGIIGPLTDKLLNRAAGLIADLSNRTYTPLKLAFNISAMQLTHDDFADRTLSSLSAAGLSPKHFEIELTESTLMQQMDGARAMLAQFRERGASISIDDFGTGFSSLAYLQEIKAQTLKIDKHFIDDCVDNKSSAQLVQSVIAMGQALNMKLIAEGVETSEKLELVASLSCDYYQGYFFSKAVPIEQFQELVMKQCDIDAEASAK
ncbi:MAG: GGDEF domain-containing phosphodiesterase [Halomonas sp.]|uniref:putative bifunctional diguanylate cyclase/phosphodiesterase n=1 Tax=Halomonas sp. TaxID=1486246 RepID=UPI0039711242